MARHRDLEEAQPASIIEILPDAFVGSCELPQVLLAVVSECISIPPLSKLSQRVAFHKLFLETMLVFVI